jgi:hypothetical protein
MEIGPEKNTIPNVVRTILRVRTDVGSLKRWQRVLVGYRARASVGFHDGHPKDSLPESRLYDLRCAISWRVFVGGRRVAGSVKLLRHVGARATLLPNAQSLTCD